MVDFLFKLIFIYNKVLVVFSFYAHLLVMCEDGNKCTNKNDVSSFTW